MKNGKFKLFSGVIQNVQAKGIFPLPVATDWDPRE
jgi:hypothetical protein